MADPFLVLLFVVAEKGHDAGAPALIAAARTALGRGVTILVHESSEMPSDTEVMAIATSAHANAAVEMRWEDLAHRYVSIHLHQDGVVGWSDRTLEFVAEDPSDERGRAVALTLSAMIWHGNPPPEPSAASATSAPVLTPPTHPITVDNPVAAKVGSLGLSGVVALGLDETSSTFGVALDARWDVVPQRLGLRVVGQFRVGDLATAAATAQQLGGGVGAAWTFFSTRSAHSLQLAVRGDVLGLRQVVSRNGTTRSRWQSGFDLAMECTWTVTSSIDLVAATGVEWAVGPTDIRVGQTQVTALPVVRWVTDIGGRVRF